MDWFALRTAKAAITGSNHTRANDIVVSICYTCYGCMYVFLGDASVLKSALCCPVHRYRRMSMTIIDVLSGAYIYLFNHTLI